MEDFGHACTYECVQADPLKQALKDTILDSTEHNNNMGGEGKFENYVQMSYLDI